jgi:hypothetical protein
MTQESQQLRKQIEKTRQHLDSLEQKLIKMQQKEIKTRTMTDAKTISTLSRQVRRKYPNVEIEKDVLALVGTLPNLSVAKDKEIVRKVIAERYG